MPARKPHCNTASMAEFTSKMSQIATNANERSSSHKKNSPITIRKPHTVTELRRINEQKLNALLPTMNLEEIVRKPMPQASKIREPLKKQRGTMAIPKNLTNAIMSLKLLDEPNIEMRIKIFIGYCKYKDYSFHTTERYFTILKRNGVFGDDDADTISTLKPNKIAFIDSGRQHVRIVGMEDFKTFAIYLTKNLSQYSAPIAIAYHTGLRTSEILQFTTYTLYQLYERQQMISIKRKQTIVSANNTTPIYWEPVYNTHLNVFVQHLIDDTFHVEYNTFMQTKINTKLFHMTPKTLGNRIRSLYFNAVGKKAPLGFGVHSCRNMIAMLMAEKSENILAIQTFLQHKNVKTTRQYIRADYTFTTEEFNRLTKYEFNDAFDKLKPIQ